MYLTTSATKTLLRTLSTGTLKQRRNALIDLFEDYILDTEIDKTQYSFHVWYLIRFEGQVNQERYLNAYGLIKASPEAQIYVAAAKLGLVTGLEPLEAALMIEMFGRLSNMALFFHSAKKSSCHNAVKELRNLSLLLPREHIAFNAELNAMNVVSLVA